MAHKAEVHKSVQSFQAEEFVHIDAKFFESKSHKLSVRVDTEARERHPFVTKSKTTFLGFMTGKSAARPAKAISLEYFQSEQLYSTVVLQRVSAKNQDSFYRALTNADISFAFDLKDLELERMCDSIRTHLILSKQLVRIEIGTKENKFAGKYILVVEDRITSQNVIIAAAPIVYNVDPVCKEATRSKEQGESTAASPRPKNKVKSYQHSVATVPVLPLQPVIGLFSDQHQSIIKRLKAKFPDKYKTDEQLRTLFDSDILTWKSHEVKQALNPDTASNVQQLCLVEINVVLDSYNEKAAVQPKQRMLFPARVPTDLPKLKPMSPHVKNQTVPIQDQRMSPLQHQALQVLKTNVHWVTDDYIDTLLEHKLLNDYVTAVILKQIPEGQLNYIKTPAQACTMIASSLKRLNLGIKANKFHDITYEQSVAAHNNQLREELIQANKVKNRVEFNQLFSSIPANKYSPEQLKVVFNNYRELAQLFQKYQVPALSVRDFAILVAEEQLNTNPLTELHATINVLFESSRQLGQSLEQFTQAFGVKNIECQWINRALGTLGHYSNCLNGIPHIDKIRTEVRPIRNGLYNWGNNCFINAALQCFSHSLVTTPSLYEHIKTLNYYSARYLLDRFLPQIANPTDQEIEHRRLLRDTLADEAMRILQAPNYGEHHLKNKVIFIDNQSVNATEYFRAFFELRTHLINLVDTLNRPIVAEMVVTPAQLQIHFFEALYTYCRLTNCTTGLAILGCQDGSNLLLSHMQQNDPQEVIKLFFELFGLDMLADANTQLSAKIDVYVKNEAIPRESRTVDKQLHCYVPIATSAEDNTNIYHHLAHHFRGSELAGSNQIHCDELLSRNRGLTKADIHTYKVDYLEVDETSQNPPETSALNFKVQNSDNSKKMVTNCWKNSPYYNRKVDLGTVLLADYFQKGAITLPFVDAQKRCFTEAYVMTSATCQKGKDQHSGHYVSLLFPANYTYNSSAQIHVYDEIVVTDDTVCLSFKEYAESKNVKLNDNPFGISDNIYGYNFADACIKLELTAYSFNIKRLNHNNNVQPNQAPIFFESPLTSLQNHSIEQSTDYSLPKIEAKNHFGYQNQSANKSEQYRKVAANKPQLPPQQTAVTLAQAQPLTQPPIPRPRKPRTDTGVSISVGKLSKDRDSHHVDKQEEVREEVSEETNLAPWDPNLTCPQCDKEHRIGEIQLFKAHFKKCDGTRADVTGTAVGLGRPKISTAQFVKPNILQDDITKAIKDAADKVKEGDLDPNLFPDAPFDPNLICPLCMKNYKVGQIQPYRKHVATCAGQ